jgi:UDP-sugar pyrophosphorylase
MQKKIVSGINSKKLVTGSYALSRNDKDFIKKLKQAGQAHIFTTWDDNSITSQQKKLLDQLYMLDQGYPGGLDTYVTNALLLLQNAKAGKNPLDGYIPTVPQGINFEKIDTTFFSHEQKGLDNIDKLRFVIVAGGLGERLGYDGIKLALPPALISMKSYLQTYCDNIKAYESYIKDSTRKDTNLDLVLMTSNDTHAQTVQLLEKNNFFGLKKEQVHLLKQGAVPALTDNAAHFALNTEGLIDTKPHGHGDIHMLIYMNKLTEKWLTEGASHVVFLQDTNGQVFNGIPAALGVSIEKDFAMNFLTTPRAAGEAAGAITMLMHKQTSKSITCNVEYNQLGPMLIATVDPAGDVADPQTGLSPFPGNLNVLMLEMRTYNAVLDKTHGLINEFINPKYIDAEKNIFKSPTRVETMMQDIAFSISHQFGGSAKIGFTNFPRQCVFSPLKNKLCDGAKIFSEGKPADSATSAENDLYAFNRERLTLAGMKVASPQPRPLKGIPFKDGAKVVLSQEFLIMNGGYLNKIRSGSISNRSVLLINGANVYLENVDIDGALILKTHPEAYVTLKDLKISNSSWDFVELTEEEMNDPQTPQYLKIRGYKVVKRAQDIINITAPGRYYVEKNQDKLKVVPF